MIIDSIFLLKLYFIAVFFIVDLLNFRMDDFNIYHMIENHVCNMLVIEQRFRNKFFTYKVFINYIFN